MLIIVNFIKFLFKSNLQKLYCINLIKFKMIDKQFNIHENKPQPAIYIKIKKPKTI